MTQIPGSTPQDEQPSPPQPTGPASPDATDGSDDPTALPRNTNRKDLPVESPGRMVLPNQQSVFVNLRDISRGGCCVVRKGTMTLQAGDRVRIEMWRQDIETKASLPAIVRWVRHHDGKTRAGLRFVDTSVKTQRLIEEYLQRSFRPGG